MKFTEVILFLAASLSGIGATPITRATKPPFFILVGDSTVATNNGWGDGFLSFVEDTASGTNRGKASATAASFRSTGRWDIAIQAETSGVNVEQYRQNLIDFANEVKAAGGTAILITSLTRRTFADGEVAQDLIVQRGKTIAAAKEAGVKWLDLNAASINYVNAIRETNAAYYDRTSGDKTHLNSAGETVFGRMVVDLLLGKRGDLANHFEANDALSAKIKDGEFATGDE